METEMSRGIKIEPIKSRLTDNERASGKEFLDSLVRAGILVEYKDHPEIDRIDLSLLHALNHNVDENVEANALKSNIEPTELSAASTEDMAEMSETLPELICDDSSHSPGMMNIEADLLSRPRA